MADARTVTVPARVRYAETDRMGVAYYANYLVWFEVGRAEWLRARGLSYRSLEESGIILPVIEAHCDYRRSLRYDDAIAIRTSAVLLSPVRVQFDYEIAGPDGAPAAAGRTVHAAADPRGRPCRLPDTVRRLFA
jgi:acyl-CoA thioester hydrolase